MTEVRSIEQKDDERELQENLPMWLIRYVMIPIVLASIAGVFALVAVDRSFQHENRPSGTTNFTEIFGTMTAAAATTQATPSPASTATGTAVPTQTNEPPTEEANSANKPPVTLDPPQPEPPVICLQVPDGWRLYTVQPGNTLFSLARETGTTVQTIRQVNCLYGELLAYSQIWLPKVFSARPEPTVETTPVVEPIETITPTVTVTEPTPLPDIVNDLGSGPSFSLSCTKACVPIFHYGVTNAGAAASGPFTVRLQLVTGQGMAFDQAVDHLEPGAVKTFTLSGEQLSGCYDSGCSICIMVDAFDAVAETSETNNQYCETFGGQEQGGG